MLKIHPIRPRILINNITPIKKVGTHQVEGGNELIFHNLFILKGVLLTDYKTSQKPLFKHPGKRFTQVIPDVTSSSEKISETSPANIKEIK